MTNTDKAKKMASALQMLIREYEIAGKPASAERVNCAFDLLNADSLTRLYDILQKA